MLINAGADISGILSYADESLKNEDYNLAMQSCRIACALEPGQEISWRLAAEIAKSSKNYILALSFLSRSYSNATQSHIRQQETNHLINAAYSAAMNLHNDGNYDSAIELSQEITRYCSESVRAYLKYFKGKCLLELGRFEEARSVLHEVEADDAASEETRHFVMHTLWGLASLVNDEKEIERLRRPHPTGLIDGLPAWDGKVHPGQRLLCRFDKGLGDTFQQLRQLRVLKDGGMTCIASAPRHLHRLLGSCPYIDGLHVLNEPALDGDVVCSTSYDGFQLGGQQMLWTGPYLFAEAAKIQEWRNRLSGLQGLKIVINGDSSEPIRRLPGDTVQKLARIPGIVLLDITRNAAAPSHADPDNVVRLGNCIDQDSDAFLDTAAILALSDLVVTADTSIGHLAGAMGRACFIALKFVPELRWGLDGQGNPYYPTIRLFRQSSPGNWESVVESMVEVISSMSGGSIADNAQGAPAGSCPAK